MSFPAVVFHSWLIGNSLPVYAVTSFLCLCFYFGWKHVEKVLGAKSDENIAEGERSIKAAEKDPSAIVVTGVHSTGATLVLSVNATQFFGNGEHGLPYFHYCSVAKWILQFHSDLFFSLAAKWYNYIFFMTVTFVPGVLFSVRTTWNETEAVLWLFR